MIRQERAQENEGDKKKKKKRYDFLLEDRNKANVRSDIRFFSLYGWLGEAESLENQHTKFANVDAIVISLPHLTHTQLIHDVIINVFFSIFAILLFLLFFFFGGRGIRGETFIAIMLTL